MTQSLLPVAAFLVLLACLPWALKWLKQRYGIAPHHDSGHLKFVSALAVGPQQRVVTVEVGPEGQRVWLTLGVTAHEISCLHQMDVCRAGQPLGGAPAQSQELR